MLTNQMPVVISAPWYNVSEAVPGLALLWAADRDVHAIISGSISGLIRDCSRGYLNRLQHWQDTETIKQTQTRQLLSWNIISAMSAISLNLLHAQYLALIVFILKLQICARKSSDILYENPWISQSALTLGWIPRADDDFSDFLFLPLCNDDDLVTLLPIRNVGYLSPQPSAHCTDLAWLHWRVQGQINFVFWGTIFKKRTPLQK